MKRLLTLSLCLALAAFHAGATVKLPSLIGDGMVLQQSSTVKIWGQALPQQKISVAPSWSEQKYDAAADSDGNWTVPVPTPSYGGPYEIEITDTDPSSLKSSSTTIYDVMIGEVWVCSGQSNMEFRVRGSLNQPMSGNADVVFRNAPYGAGFVRQWLRGFEVAGKNKKFFPAQAQVHKNTNKIRLICKQVGEIVAVRYAFRNWPGEVDLYNNYGLPAYPYRSDDWDDVK